MKRWRYFIPLALFLCAVVTFVFYPTDEKRIRKIINNAERAISSKDIDKLMDVISFNYKDDYGNGYLQIKKTAELAFRRLNDIEIEKNILAILVKEDNAEVELSVRVIASSIEGEGRGYIIGDAGKAERIKVFFEKSPHKWLVTKVEGVKVFMGPRIEGFE